MGIGVSLESLKSELKNTYHNQKWRKIMIDFRFMALGSVCYCVYVALTTTLMPDTLVLPLIFILLSLFFPKKSNK
jgi:hypothetical protein